MIDRDKIIIALDSKNIFESMLLTQQIQEMSKYAKTFKIGPVLYSYLAINCTFLLVAKTLKNLDCKLFLDLKLYDIPSTINKTLNILDDSDLVDMITVHRDCVPWIDYAALKSLNILSVNRLTSDSRQMSPDQFDQYVRANRSVSGFITPSTLIKDALKTIEKGQKIIVPGIRRKNDSDNDQKIVCTPKYAIEQGADMIILGRTIFAKENPVQELKEIVEQGE